MARPRKPHVHVYERKDRPGTWRVELRGVGVRRRTATFQSRADAEHIARAFRDLARAERESERADDLEALHEVFRIDRKRRRVRRDTLLAYDNHLGSVIRHMGNLPLEEITSDALLRFYDLRRTSGRRDATVRTELNALSVALQWALRKGWVPANPVPAFLSELPRLERKQKEWLRDEEIPKVLIACDPVFRSIAMVAIYAGLRRREVVQLERQDVDLPNGVVRVRNSKGKRPRSIPILRELLPVLERQLGLVDGRCRWICPTRTWRKRSDDTTFFAAKMREISGRALSRRVTFHDLRRTCGALLLRRGFNLFEVSRILGHRDVKTTQEIYAPICDQDLVKKARWLEGESWVAETARISHPALP